MYEKLKEAFVKDILSEASMPGEARRGWSSWTRQTFSEQVRNAPRWQRGAKRFPHFGKPRLQA
jgi:hypothetical protein